MSVTTTPFPEKTDLDREKHFRFDEEDPVYHQVTKQVGGLIGQLHEVYPFYFYVEDKNLHITLTVQQISKIGYDDNDDKYYGIYHNKKTNVSQRVEIFPDWISANFGEEYIEYLDKHPLSQTEFLALPIGSARTVSTKQNIVDNPVIKYQQAGESVCVFTSLSSVLHHLGYYSEAAVIDDYRSNHFKTIMKEYPHRIMECVIDFIQRDHRFYHFKAKYMWRKINSNHDLVQAADFSTGDFRWVSLWSEDGAMNHAVAVCEKWIFDGNCTNALILSKESLDECCGDSAFVSIRKGFLFTLKQDEFSYSKNARKRKRRKELKRKRESNSHV